jgi:hypothetical protein
MLQARQSQPTAPCLVPHQPAATSVEEIKGKEHGRKGPIWQPRLPPGHPHLHLSPSKALGQFGDCSVHWSMSRPTTNGQTSLASPSITCTTNRPNEDSHPGTTLETITRHTNKIQLANKGTNISHAKKNVQQVTDLKIPFL